MLYEFSLLFNYQPKQTILNHRIEILKHLIVEFLGQLLSTKIFN